MDEQVTKMAKEISPHVRNAARMLWKDDNDIEDLMEIKWMLESYSEAVETLIRLQKILYIGTSQDSDSVLEGTSSDFDADLLAETNRVAEDRIMKKYLHIKETWGLSDGTVLPRS